MGRGKRSNSRSSLPAGESFKGGGSRYNLRRDESIGTLPGDRGRKKKRGGGGGGTSSTSAKQVRGKNAERRKREKARSLHKDWDVLIRFIIIGVVIYIIPSIAELVIAAVWWPGCGEDGRPVKIWMFIDAAASLVSCFTLCYWTWTMHYGIANDEELKGYLYNRENDIEDYQRLELKYNLLRKKSRLVPECFHAVPYVVTIGGLVLWIAAGESDSADLTCEVPDAIVLAIALSKIIIPALLGMGYGCLFLFINFCKADDEQDEQDQNIQDKLGKRGIEMKHGSGKRDVDRMISVESGSSQDHGIGEARSQRATDV